MKFNSVIAKLNTGLILGLCLSTFGAGSQRQTQQQKHQRVQSQKQHRQQGQESGLATHTRENIMKALQREALASIKYRVFAEVAKENGKPELADLFMKTAETESDQHLKSLFELAKIVGSDIENLKNAIGNETYESTLMYKKYAEMARKNGDIEVAQRFEEIARDEAEHRKGFVVALEALRAQE